MFCDQCEQTAKGQACTVRGVCGKAPEVDYLQDLLLYMLEGISIVALEGQKVGVRNHRADVFTCEALFSTLTNVNFDPQRFVDYVKEATEIREALKAQVKEAGGNVDFPQGPATFQPAATQEEMIKQGEMVELRPTPDLDRDIFSLKETLLYGIKGMASYLFHAQELGQEDNKAYDFIYEGLAALQRNNLSLDDWLGLVLKCGEMNLLTMELLDKANTGTYGDPQPTPVSLGAKKGKAILVSGHNLRDLDDILKQTEGKGIYVYTHGEMLPCHGYPELNKYPHLVGHYGTAWQNQQKEFAQFPGSIVMTTNCLMPPKESYKDNLFTVGPVGWPGVTHITGRDFSAAIQRALELPGFPEDREGKTVMVGFAHNAVLSVADKVVEAVKSGKIRHFFLVGGCDGAKPGRNYYTEFVEKAPKDTVILTLACGKFRFFDKDLGSIDGLPRLLDVGQCNDAYSAIQIALALANAFDCNVNELPLSMILSWFEQKAVAILLTLLHLGIKDMRLGPSLPAFISPNVLDVLVKNFDLKPITTPEEDLKAILG